MNGKMTQTDDLRICEKPDSVSYEEIRGLLQKAGERNRKDGFTLGTSRLSAEQLRQRIGESGKCFVALDGTRLAGTVSVRFIRRNAWYAKGETADYILAAVDPEYQGRHILSRLSEEAFRFAEERGCPLLELDTAEQNRHAIDVYRHYGFVPVGYKASPNSDHYSVIMVKWLKHRPYSAAYCFGRYRLKKAYVRLRFTPDRQERFGHSVLRKGLALAGRSFRKERVEAALKYAQEGAVPERRVRADMLREYLRSNTSPDEYYRFQFYDKTAEERDAYFQDWERKRWFSGGAWSVLPKDKYERCLLFRDLYHRDVTVIRFGENGAEEAYREFRRKHARFIAKPVRGLKGKGVRVLEAADVPSTEALRETVGADCMLEELITQGDELAAFHPASVNTLRLVTAVADSGEAVVVFALLRTGQGGSVVDNVGSGGIISRVETSSGTVVSDGLRGIRTFETHPDSGIRFKGTVIPAWEAACTMAKNAHLRKPEQRLIGWDLAWTKTGWDVVEMNPSPSFQSIQVLMGKGIRPELQNIFGELR